MTPSAPQTNHYITHPLFPASRIAEALDLARAYFALPVAEKREMAIERSPHFRGYSEMRNDRDWREQFHFGREEMAVESGPVYEQLRGPNLWPRDGGLRDAVVRLMADLEIVAREVLGEFRSDSPYLLLKMIHYPVSPDGVPRSGVAAHVDFSWITLVLQDADGLEVRNEDGEWLPLPPQAGALVLNIGEILQFTTGGRLQATPHRVVNRSSARSRISMPFFFNPGLSDLISLAESGERRRVQVAEHVHRVMSGREQEPFVFGDAEWRRKGLNVWCRECVRD